MRFLVLVALAGCHISPAEYRFRATDWLDIGAGEYFSCGIHGSKGDIQCWGGKDTSLAETYEPPTDNGFTELSMGHSFGCALDDGGNIECWGENEYLQLEPPDGSFDSVAVGSVFGCAIDDETVECWFDGETFTVDGNYQQVVVGGYGCGLKNNGNIACWDNSGADTSHDFEGTYSFIDMEDTKICAIVGTDGSVECDDLGYSSYSEPPEGSDFVQLALEGTNLCALDGNGEFECTHTTDYAPPDHLYFSMIDGGVSHSCGITTNGGAYCWGNDNYGKLHP